MTPAIPTSEFQKEETSFNDMQKRNSSTYAKILGRVAREDIFGSTANQRIEKDLSNEKLKVKIGWVVCVVWVAPCFALAAVLIFLLARCVAGRQSSSSSSQPKASKPQKNTQQKSTSESSLISRHSSR